MVLVITQSGSTKIGSTTYTLKCEISPFTFQAVWSRNNISMSTCFDSGCLTTSSPPYSFRHDSTAIYVDFDTLNADENGAIWKCEHGADNPVEFKVEVEDKPTGIEFGIEAVVVVGIGIGLLIQHLAHRGDEKVCYVNEGGAISLPLPDIRTHSWKQDPNSKTIEIPKVTVDSEALYDCSYGTKTLKYRLVVVGTEEIVKTKVGGSVVFGKHIADGDAKTDVVWTKNGAIVKLNHPEPTKVKINEASITDQGKYVCTFGPSKMKLTYNLVIIEVIA